MSRTTSGISVSVTPLRAQVGANVEGTVTDALGAVVPNATVTLTNNETKRKQTTTTSAEVFYRFTGLASRTYTLTG